MSDLRFVEWDAVNEEWDTVNTSSLGISGVKLTRSTSHPASLQFTATAANHTFPMNYQTFLRVWDQGAKLPDGTTDQDVDHPIFEGWVEVVTPAQEANEVSITAYDPSYRAARLTLMNLPWVDGETPDSAAYPRFAFNCTQDASQDYALCRSVNTSLGGILQTVLDDHILPLRAIHAAPADPDVPYDSTELAALSTEPQSTVSGQSESIRSMIERVISAHEPANRMVWEPGTRVFRFQNLKEAPEVTVTLNDPSNATGMVLSADIQRSAEGRFGAIEIYGPPTVEWATATWGSGGTDTLDVLDDYTAGDVGSTFTCYWKFQVVDPGYTSAVTKAPYPITVPGPVQVYSRADGSIPDTVIGSTVATFWPAFVVTFADNDGGSDIPVSFSGWTIDSRTGIITFGDTCVARYNPTGTPKLETPVQIDFHYPRVAECLKVRVPETGFEGTAYTDGGLENVLRLYDESLAVGYEYGNPVSTVTRIARFTEFATQLLEQKKDLIYTGGMTFEGMAYEFGFLNRRVNIEAKDDDGAALDVGWDEIGALVTDVEYDYEQGTTTITFSSDQLEALSIDPEEMKARLKIRPAEKVFFYNWSMMMFRRSADTYSILAGKHSGDVVAVSTVTSAYLDEFGEIQ